MEAEGSTGGGVRILSRRMVRPEAATSSPSPTSLPEPETIHLTPWDLKMITVDYIQKGVLLPKPPAGGQHAVELLRSSFARALGRFFPLAGRLAAAPVSPRSVTVSLRCNGEGAEFVHAVAPGVAVADITGSVLIPRVVWSFFPLNGVLGTDAAVDSRPVLSAQVTELADGVFVAMSLNHGVADGSTFWHLFNTWSEMSRRGCGGGTSTLLPESERWFLEGCPVPIPLPFGKLEDIVRRPEYLPVQECFFHFSAESVKKLKATANAEMAGAAISSLQSLLAHLWRAVCRARGLAADQETTYVLLVGCRARVKGIPQGYVGNAVTLAATTAAAGEIMEEGLGRTAWRLNRAVAAVDEASLRETLASWPENPSFSFMQWQPEWSPATIGTGSSPRFDVYGNDFGWGRPVGVRSGAGNKKDGKATVYEGRDGGGSMALEVCLAPAAAARLVADKEFMDAVGAA